MVRRGLIIAHFFPPVGGGGVQRWSKFIKYLSCSNWQFTVVTRKPSRDEIKDLTLLKDIPNSTNVIGVFDKIANQPYKFKSNYFKRWMASLLFISDSRKYWVNKAWQKVEEELSQKKYDVVICSIPPYSVADLVININKHFSHIPVVLDMRDPWSINPYKIYPTLFHKFLDRKKELQIISKTDYIISAYQSSLDFYRDKMNNFDNKKSTVISNGFDEDDIKNLKPKKLPNPDYFNIAFSGTFYSHLNNPGILFEALAILKKEGQQINFHHIGASVYDVESLAKKFGIEDMLVNWGYRNHLECLNILSSMDAFTFILDPRVKNAANTIGGKVYEYLGLKKPVLALIPGKGEAAKLISDSNSGIMCESSSPPEVAKAIAELKTDKFKFIGIECFSRKKLSNQLNEFLIKIISEHNDDK